MIVETLRATKRVLPSEERSWASRPIAQPLAYARSGSLKVHRLAKCVKTLSVTDTCFTTLQRVPSLASIAEVLQGYNYYFSSTCRLQE
ncbi:hypothetical protein J6590_024674 [Homalodisca vitripennis]|nr:hypothetical protein J6590_024674 [Homalodisca vitripennis]